MKYLFFVLLIVGLWACYDDADNFKPTAHSCYGVGTSWRCSNNLVQVCDEYNSWDTYQDCKAAGKLCYEAYSSQCGGYEYPCCH